MRVGAGWAPPVGDLAGERPVVLRLDGFWSPVWRLQEARVVMNSATRQGSAFVCEELELVGLAGAGWMTRVGAALRGYPMHRVDAAAERNENTG